MHTAHRTQFSSCQHTQPIKHCCLPATGMDSAKVAIGFTAAGAQCNCTFFSSHYCTILSTSHQYTTQRNSHLVSTQPISIIADGQLEWPLHKCPSSVSQQLERNATALSSIVSTPQFSSVISIPVDSILVLSAHLSIVADGQLEWTLHKWPLSHTSWSTTQLLFCYSCQYCTILSTSHQYTTQLNSHLVSTLRR